jgi:ribosomal protein S18 acetylase RimI-like enzyme
MSKSGERFVSEFLAKHDRTAFASGNERIDTYFRSVVSQDVKRDYAACHVLVEKQTGKIAGFYTLTSSNIPLTAIPQGMARKLPRYPNVPAVLIGWLARDIGFRGQNIGSMLLYDAFARIATSPAAAYAIFADAIDDEAAEFYKKHLFTPFAAKPRSLFLPLATVRELVEKQ